MINAGKYDKKIKIYKKIQSEDDEGFPINREEIILLSYANVKTTKGFTMIQNNSDFEKAYTNFTIRYSKKVVEAYYESDDSNRDMFVEFNGKIYTTEYLNNVDEANVELEMQCKLVLK